MFTESIRAYRIDNAGRVEIDMAAVRFKGNMARRAVRRDLVEQAKRETTETLRRVVATCARTYLAKVSADELARREKIGI